MNAFDVASAGDAGQLIYWLRHGEQLLEVREDQQFRWLLLDGIVQSVLPRAQPASAQ